MWLVDIILDRIGPDQSFGREWTLWSTLTTMFNTSLNKTTVCLTLKLTSNYWSTWGAFLETNQSAKYLESVHVFTRADRGRISGILVYEHVWPCGIVQPRAEVGLAGIELAGNSAGECQAALLR